MMDTRSLLNRAVAYQNSGDDVAAEQVLQTLVSLEPENVETLVRLGVCCLNLGRFGHAEAHLARAASIAPHSAEVLAYHAVALFRLGHIARAEAMFEAVRRVVPDRDDLAGLLPPLQAQPHLTAPVFYHGSHKPVRQVFMSAALDLVRRPGEPLTLLEIGSYMGASMFTWGNAARRLHDGPASILCIDAWGADESNSIDAVNSALRSDQAFEVFVHNARVIRPFIAAEYRRGLSAEILPELADGAYDLVYVDGCHCYPEARDDITEAKRLVRDGGIVCGDDLEAQLHECDETLVRSNQRTDFIFGATLETSFHPGVTLAVGESFGPVSAFEGFWAMRRNGDRFEPISLAHARGVLPLHWPEGPIDAMRQYFASGDKIAALV